MPAARDEDHVARSDRAFDRPRIPEEWEFLEVRAARLYSVVVQQIRLIRGEENPPFPPDQLGQPRMRSPYVAMKWRERAPGADEDARINQPHVGRQERKPVKEVFRYLVIAQQLLVRHEQPPVI